MSGLRDNFNPRARWKAAIAGARALHRLGSANSKISISSKSSGGWKSTIDTDDSDDEVVAPESVPAGTRDEQNHGPGENAFVTVTAPDEDLPEAQLSDTDSNAVLEGSPPEEKPSDAHEPKQEYDARQEKKVPQEAHEDSQTSKNPNSSTSEHTSHDDDDDELAMPGSFSFRPQPHGHHGHYGLADFFRKMHIKSH